jgi:hypothetical protein
LLVKNGDGVGCRTSASFDLRQTSQKVIPNEHIFPGREKVGGLPR